ncbi:putative F-box/kelch-repeat protein At1g20940 [Nicotiana sylvestris]|uniref:F-box/kelch-repeat protein At1g20940 n=1 Tax=Nicotiana sylvestris TaxID=4096 RepID=A0A1U7WJY8_NICSY|nr:PREDICTED: putative F-box/kelch-repeat protein At1g20940 [Nicotiana sylvestris]
MELNEDLVLDIISRLPVKLALQCRVLSKSFNNKLCEPNVCQSYASRWFQDQNISKLLIYSSSSLSSSRYEISNFFCKVYVNPSRDEISTISPLNVSVLSSCKGLLLLEFHQLKTFCIFNPITGMHQLIPYPELRNYFSTRGGGVGLVVDHPTPNGHYKLVTIGMLNRYEGYKFCVFSSEEAGVVWHEFQLRMDVRGDSLVNPQPVYVHDCLHWLRNDGSILAFDTKSSSGKASIFNRPEIITRYFFDPMYGIISFPCDAWLGVVRGVLTLVCVFKKFIVIFGYDHVSRNWTVSYTLPNFMPDLRNYGDDLLKWFDGKKLFFVVNHSASRGASTGYLYEYDTERKTYEKVDTLLLDMDSTIFFSFEPTLANVHKTVLPPYTIHSKHFPAIATILNEFRYLIANYKPRVECVPERAENKFPCNN